MRSCHWIQQQLRFGFDQPTADDAPPREHDRSAPRLASEELRAKFVEYVTQRFEWVPKDQKNYRLQLEFAAGRIEEGISLERYFADHLSSDADQRVLDIGSGNGGVILPFANAGHPAFAFDIVPNPDVRELTRLFHVPLKSVVGINGLPFADDSFALVLLLDVIEHVKDRAGLCSEIMRVLQPGGKCMITTPPRLRYFLEPDPHFGVRSLVMLPNGY